MVKPPEFILCYLGGGNSIVHYGTYDRYEDAEEAAKEFRRNSLFERKLWVIWAHPL